MDLTNEQKYQKLLANSVNSFYSETVNFKKNNWSTKLIYYGMSLIAVSFFYFYISSIFYQEFDKAFKDVKNGESLRIFCRYILPFLIFSLGAVLAIFSFFKRRELENGFEYFEDWEFLYELRSKIIVDNNLKLLNIDEHIYIFEDNQKIVSLIGAENFLTHRALNFQYDKNLISYGDIYFPNNKNDFTYLKFFGLELTDQANWFESELLLEISEDMQIAFLNNKIEDFLYNQTGFDKDNEFEAQQVQKICDILKFDKWLGDLNLKEFGELTLQILENKIYFCFNFKVYEEIFNHQCLDYIKKDVSKSNFKNLLASKIDFELLKMKELFEVTLKIIKK
ncbi:hypothetical protein [Spiroplasma endosymbiont of Panorpa germanica]|uniref:hypothetical protein n=1 Tax=Spiroplasma endosymbiont of Panorpa germanica TaxID=3066314 RepID=UPI0030CCF778